MNYKKYGYCGLEKKDYKISRKLNNDVIQRIITIRQEFSSITTTKSYDKLIEEKYINSTEIPNNLILRFIRVNNLKASQVTNIERRMFEMKNVNDCWQADTSEGPYVTIDNKKYRTKLIMFIDDKSRMITGYDFFFNVMQLICRKFSKMR